MVKKRDLDNISKEILKEDIKLKKEEKNRKKLIVILAIISVAGFFISFLFLIGITGAVIGQERGNLYGMILIIISLLAWAFAELLWVREKKKKEMSIKKLLEELEKEGVPLNMLYRKYL